MHNHKTEIGAGREKVCISRVPNLECGDTLAPSHSLLQNRNPLVPKKTEIQIHAQRRHPSILICPFGAQGCYRDVSPSLQLQALFLSLSGAHSCEASVTAAFSLSWGQGALPDPCSQLC